MTRAAWKTCAMASLPFAGAFTGFLFGALAPSIVPDNRVWGPAWAQLSVFTTLGLVAGFATMVVLWRRRRG